MEGAAGSGAAVGRLLETKELLIVHTNYPALARCGHGSTCGGWRP